MKSNYTKPKWALYQNGAIVHKAPSQLKLILDKTIDDMRMSWGTTGLLRDELERSIFGASIVPRGYRLLEMHDHTGYQLVLEPPTAVRQEAPRPGLFTRLRNLFI